MKTAVIDIGSNTVKLDIFSVSGKEISHISARSEKGALARYTKSGYLSDDGYAVLKGILGKYTIAAASAECEKIYVFATQSLRDISNADEVCKSIKCEFGIDVEIISGQEEAQCSFRALMLNCANAENGIMADMGGGSLELVEFTNRTPENICSLPLGALRVKEFLDIGTIPSKEDEEKISKYVTQILDNSPIRSKNEIYLIGGTARSMFSLCFEGKNEISPAEAERAYTLLSKGGENTLKLLSAKLPKRTDNFMTGFYVFNLICKYYKTDKIVLSKMGVRDGYLIKKLENDDIR